jgi:hypothetical protein
MNQSEAHLIVAGIRVFGHLHQRAPRPEELAEFLQIPPAMLRMQLSQLEEAQIVRVVTSAFDVHVEIGDHRLVEELAAETDGGDLTEDLADFDRRKQEEAARMERLFAEGDHQKKQAERLGKMEEELRQFGKKKPKNPFGDD